MLKTVVTVSLCPCHFWQLVSVHINVVLTSNIFNIITNMNNSVFAAASFVPKDVHLLSHLFMIIFSYIICFYRTSCLDWLLLEIWLLSAFLRLLSTSLSVILPSERLAFHILTTKLPCCDAPLCLMINTWLCMPWLQCKHCVNLFLQTIYIRIISSLLILSFFVRCYCSSYSHEAIDINLHVGQYTHGISLSAFKF